MTLNDLERPHRTTLPYTAFFEARCAEVNKDRLVLSAVKDKTRSVDFSCVQIVHKFAE